MREKSLSEELEAIVSAWTFADMAKALEPFSRRWQSTPYYARTGKGFETLPRIVRKRFAKLRVIDAAALIVGMAKPDKRALVRPK
jgi:hypothetical protein